MTDDCCASTCGNDAAPADALDFLMDAANVSVSLADDVEAPALTWRARVSQQARTALRAEAKEAVPAT